MSTETRICIADDPHCGCVANTLRHVRAVIESAYGWPVFAEDDEPAVHGNLIDRSVLLNALEDWQLAVQGPSVNETRSRLPE